MQRNFVGLWEQQPYASKQIILSPLSKSSGKSGNNLFLKNHSIMIFLTAHLQISIWLSKPLRAYSLFFLCLLFSSHALACLGLLLMQRNYACARSVSARCLVQAQGILQACC